VREGDWKLVVTSRADGSPATFLFDLKADPKETRDLSAREPARVRRLTEAFAVWDKGNIPSRMQGRLHDSRIAGQDVKVRY
jgi:arylsulfatase